MSTLAHHGFVYVPLGYKNTFPILTNVEEVRGGEYLRLSLVLHDESLGCPALSTFPPLPPPMDM